MTSQVDEDAALTFQLVSWWAVDVVVDDDDDDDDNDDTGFRRAEHLRYAIKLFGRDERGTSVSCTVADFTPFFFVKLHDARRAWTRGDVDRFVEAVYQKTGKPWLAGCIIDARIVKRKDFWGFTNEMPFSFLRLCFAAERHMKQVARAITLSTFALTGIAQRTFPLYESNIAPFLRFAHIQGIAPAGWVTVPRRACNFDDVLMPSKCQVDGQCNWKAIRGVPDRTDIAPLKIVSFDIECVSSDMDFPVARKNYVKVASDVYNLLNGSNLGATLESWKDSVARTVLEKYDTKAMIPFSRICRSAVEETILQHCDHIMLIVRGDKTIIDNALRKAFEEAKLTPSTFLAFLAQAEKTSKTATSATATRLALGAWLHKVFRGKSQDAEAAVGRIIGMHMREKDALVGLLTAYLDEILPPVRGDEIIQIGVTSHRYGETDCSEKIMVSLGTCAAIEGVRIVECRDEQELLAAWVDVMTEVDPDIVCGYNIFGFDFRFIEGRARELGCVAKTSELGRLADAAAHPAQFKEARLSSSALGDNVMYYYDMPGRTCLDLMKVIQRDHKLDSYKLDAVASHFMGLHKKDVSPSDIFRLAKGSAVDRAIVADYCIQDCELCNRLVMKLETVANNAGMACVCSVPLHYIFMRGQGVKIFSLVAKMCRELGFLVPTLRSPYEEDPSQDEDAVDGYEGAIVLEPKVGVYIDAPVAVLDYASLYPSSMISENLSHDCIVLDEAYDNVPGVTYRDVTYDLYEGVGEEKVKVGERRCRYAHKTVGVIPYILQDLLKQRKLTRKRMGHKRLVTTDGAEWVGVWEDATRTMTVAATGDTRTFCAEDVKCVEDAYSPFQKATLDGLQLAYKITANSLYGQVGSRTSPVYLKDIAACTTATGRRMILLAKDFLEEEYQADIIYGDSVPGYTPCLLRVDGSRVEVVAVEEIAERFGAPCAWRPCRNAPHHDKEAMQIRTGVETWTSEGWTPLLRLIRHELAPHKSIIRVATPGGVVDVTDDHSLLTADGNVVSPVDLRIGDRLMGAWPQMRHALAADDDDAEARCLDRAHAQGVCFVVQNDRVPEDVLNAPLDVREAFWAGVRDGYSRDSHDSEGGGVALQDQLSACGLMLLMRSIGLAPRVTTIPDRLCGDIRYVVREEKKEEEERFAVRALSKVPCKGRYVYDLTTDNHQFHAGAGGLIVHNTDSLFVHFPKQTAGTQGGKAALRATIDAAIHASLAIKPKLPAPHDLEYEKTYWPFILFSKKRYVANQYGADVDRHKQSSMGIVLKRRDNAPIVKHVYGGIIDIILNRHDVPASIAFLLSCLDELADGRRPLEDLIISKSLKGHYKDPTRIAHKVLADRIKERNPGNAPQVNDRIPYVYVVSEQPGRVLQGDKIEHPDFIRERGLRPDYEFYISNQIMKPVLQLYALVLEQLPGYVLPERGYWTKTAATLAREGKSDRAIREKVRDMREAQVKRLLFDQVFKRIQSDPAMIEMRNKRDGNRSITEWFSRQKHLKAPDPIDSKPAMAAVHECAASRRYPKKKGLMNLGNTCYINTAVQCLLAVPDFIRLMLGLPRDPSNGLVTALVDLFVDMLLEADGRPNQVVSPARFVAELRRAMSLRVHDPNDVHEFLALFIDKINASVCVKLEPKAFHDAEFRRGSELVPYTRMQKLVRIHWYKAVWQEYSVIKDMFYGMTITQIRCNNCGKIHHNYEVFSNVLLPAPTMGTGPASLPACLDAYFEEEAVSEEWKCDACNEGGQSNMKVSRMCRLPKVLMVCVQRFVGTAKNKEIVDAPHTLDVAQWTLRDEPCAEELCTSYELKAMACHSGDHNHGHYWALVREDAEPRGWQKIDDAFVHAVAPPSSAGGVSAPPEAYMFVYERRLNAN